MMRTAWKRQHPLATMLALVVAAGIALAPTPAGAQCNPSFDQNCYNGGDPNGPDISVTPKTETYYLDAADPAVRIPVTISISDAAGIVQQTLQLVMWNGTTSYPVTGFSWEPNSSSTFAFVRGTVSLSPQQVGDNILTVQVSDQSGNVGSARATYTISITDPDLPLVWTTPHHDHFRDTSLGATQMNWAMPSYTSLDTERSVGLYYNSEQADPTAFVQVDVQANPRNSSAVTMFSLQVFERLLTGQTVAVTPQYVWSKEPSGFKQRLAARWSMRNKPTGRYKYSVEVRAYRADQTYKPRSVTMYVLVVNESENRLGSGWSLAMPRVYPLSGGVLLTEGNGIARFFESGTCTGVECTFRTPAGDFTTLVRKSATGEYERIYTDGSKVTFSSAGLATRFADRFGLATVVGWTTAGPSLWIPAAITDPIGKQSYFEYRDGYLLSLVEPAGRKADFAFGQGSTGPLGGVAAALVSINGPVKLTATYDSSYRLKSYTDERGYVYDLTYDDRGTAATITAPQIAGFIRPLTKLRSLQTATTLLPGTSSLAAPAPAVATSNAMSSVTDPGGHVTSTSMDRYGNPLEVVDHSGFATENRWTTDGLPLSITDGRQTALYEWTTRGQLISKVIGANTVYAASYIGTQLEWEVSGDRQEWYSYGPAGEVVRTWWGTRADIDRNATVYQYDPSYRLIAATGPVGERYEWSYSGNAWLNLSEETVVRADGSRVTTRFAYDGAGRVNNVTNALNQITKTEYDVLNRPVKITDPLNGATTFTYAGRLLNIVTDAAGKKWTYDYNTHGWLMREIFPDGKIRRYEYNVDGLVTKIVDRRNLAIDMTYDDRHRLVTRTADGKTATFTYTGMHKDVAENAEMTETTEYDPDGYVWKTSSKRNLHTYEVQRIREAAVLKGFDVHRYLSGGWVRTDSVRYTIDTHPVDTTLGSALTVKDLSGLSTTFGYDRSGRHVSSVFPNGVKQTNAFTADGRLTRTMFSGSGPNSAFGAQYTYDVLGALSTKTAADEDKVWTYIFDSLGRLGEYRLAELIQAINCNPSFENCDPYWETTRLVGYTYDSIGNRTDSGAAVEANSNRYTAFKGFTLEYDAEGNVTRKYKPGFDQRLTWNALGQLTSVTTNGSVVTYGYSALGRRVRRTTGGVNTFFLYANDDILMEIDGTGEPLRAYTHLPGIDQPLSLRVGQTSVYYYTLEQPGHVTGLMNASGGVAANYKYSPFGELESSTATVDQPLRYMARELDSSTGLYYVRNRWYDPVLSRWLSEDPIGLAGGINSYAYVDNDPINFVDPNGTSKCKQYVVVSDETWKALGPEGRKGLVDKMGICPYLLADGTEADASLPALVMLMVDAGVMPESDAIILMTAHRTDGIEPYVMSMINLWTTASPIGAPFKMSLRGRLVLNIRNTTVLGRMNDVAKYAGRPGYRTGGWANWDKWTNARRYFTEYMFIRGAMKRGDAIRLISPDGGGPWTKLEIRIAEWLGAPVFPPR
jgi:RHS repeat-associated protein